MKNALDLHQQQGMFLIEAIVAVALASIAILLNLQIQSDAQRTSLLDRDLYRAMLIAENSLNELYFAQATDSRLTVGEHTAAADSQGLITSTPGKYEVKWTVTADRPVAKVLEISLSVSWRTEVNNKSIQMMTYRTGQ